MHQAFENAVKWLLVSSSDSTNVSLTIRGILVGAIPTFMLALGFAHVDLGQTQLTDLFKAVSDFIQAALTVIGTGMTLYGATRKVWNTILPQWAY